MIILTKAKKVVHKESTLDTACGINIATHNVLTRPSWRGVTCERCKKVRDAAAKASAAAKAAKKGGRR